MGVVICSSGGVWAVNDPAWNGGLEIRRFSKDGQLLNYIFITLPVEKLDRDWVDMAGKSPAIKLFSAHFPELNPTCWSGACSS
jgi:hypothetical protein